MKPRREPGKPSADAGRVDPSDLGLTLARLPHDHELVVAARLALETRADRLHSYDDYPGGRFHRIHDLPEHTDLEKARWGPTGDRDLWVRYGPAGPPAIPEQRDEPPQWIPAGDQDDGAARVRGR
jgi:hypothetical protein